MNTLKHTLRLFTILSLFALAVPAAAQDLLARQAPIDRKMRSIDSLALQRLLQTPATLFSEDAAGLYPEWNNTSIRKYSAELPREYKIDLRGFVMPTPSRRITSKFGARWGRQHEGLDIKVYTGDTIYAAFTGKVRIVRYDGRGYGKFVVIRHGNGLETLYGHLSKQLVDEDQMVEAGQPIGLGGNTGRSFGSHLHFETRILGTAINPALLFDFVNQDVTGDYYVFHSDTYQRESAEANQALVMNGEVGYTPTKNTTTSYSSEKAVRYHKIKKGETLSRIAKKCGTTIDALCRQNGISRTTRLRPGQILRYS